MSDWKARTPATYYANRIARKIVGRFIFDPNTNPRAHRTDCGYGGFCDCGAHK